MPKPIVSLRLNVSTVLYEKISAYRHEARHETRAQAMTALLAAGLQSLAKPAESSKPNGAKKLIGYAGRDSSEHRPAEWRAP